MSNIYILEPPTEGKVLLHTTVGEIDIELWSKEAPKACRNFVQLCMEGYYDGTIFHRIVKDFIAQGGDPTGTGTGGESIYGKPFKDEFHQRLKFNHRGLVAMANAGVDDNQSQFFFTLDRTDELDKKHTIFGKVAGNTIYNMIRLNELDVGENERPIEPPKIRRTEILSNPFDDIVPRKSKKDIEKEENLKKKKVKSNSHATKNYKLLSFGEEAEEDEEETEVVTKELKIKSSHDALDDPKLSMLPAVDESEMNSLKPDTQPKKPIEQEAIVIENEVHIEPETETEKEEREKEEKRFARKAEMKKLKRNITGKDKEEIVVDTNEKKEKEVVATNDLMQQLMDERKAFLNRKKSETILKKGGSREEETLALLSGFATKLETIESDEEEKEEKEEKEDGEDEDEDEDELNDGSWMGHHLKFAEEMKNAKDANMKDDDWYDIYDPRNPINQRRRENSKKDNSERKGNDANVTGKREWDIGKR